MRRPEVEFARAADGAYLAYQTFGGGPINLLWQEEVIAMVDTLWESPAERALHEGLAEFARVTIYDKRGTGLSSRNVAPGNLETQVEDTLAVLDAQGIERAVFGGILECGATNALLAATFPSRVTGLVWVEPSARTTSCPDYPWGVDDGYRRREREINRHWGTLRWAHEFIELNSNVMGGPWATEEYAEFLARASRRTCSPDVVQDLSEIWYETDVRGILPTIQAPVLLMPVDSHDGVAEARSIAAQLVDAEILTFPGPYLEVADFEAIHSGVRQFLGAERPVAGLESILATVLFTDVVGSTERAATVGDQAWRDILEQHDQIVRHELTRHRGEEIKRTGDGFLATFDGPARGVRCAQSIVDEVRRLGIEVRAGLHTGEIERREDADIAGLSVAIAARVCALAAGSQVLISQTVKDLVAGSGLGFTDAGVRELKGVPDRWPLYEVAGQRA